MKLQVEGSNIFSVQDKYLHVELSGETFSARNIALDDLPFFKELFANENVVRLYATGEKKSAEWAQGRFNISNQRFSDLQPHGWLTILNKATSAPIGFVVAGGGDLEGESEIAGALEANSWGKKIASEILQIAVEKWGSEVRSVGKGEIFDNRFAELQKSFTCFEGGILSKFVAVHSPQNIASGRVLQKAGFVASTTNLDTTLPFDLSSTKLSFANTSDLQAITEKFFADGRKADIKYPIVNSEGETGTISFKSDYKAFRLHVEKTVQSKNEKVGRQ